MSRKKQKLELTWIGKDKRPRLEPRILLEDAEKSYHVNERITEKDTFDNKLIFGDNLLALKGLEAEYAGQVKCIYIDPPFNTGAAFDNYEDGLEHSIWLDLMHQRISILNKLLREDGCIFIHLDDNEVDYLKVILDEIFGRENFINRITVDARSPSAFSTVNPGVFKSSEYILWYAKKKSAWESRSLRIPSDRDTAYSKFIPNKHEKTENWKIQSLKISFLEQINADRLNSILEFINAFVKTAKEFSAKEVANYFDDNFKYSMMLNIKNVSSQFRSKMAKLNVDDFTIWAYEYLLERVSVNYSERELDSFVFENADKVFRPTEISDSGAGQETVALKKVSKANPGIVYCQERDGYDNIFILNGQQLSFYDKNVSEVDGRLSATKLLTNVWSDISWEGIAKEGGVTFKKGKKPERLIKRCLELTSNVGDLILDSFGGSGTTAAVAHKMGRRWIVVELGEQCHTHIIPRMKRIIDGSDQTGISKDVNWQGGGGFRYYRLAPSMLEKDKWGNWVISKDYNAGMLTEAMCKHMGFTYAPDESHYWMHGHSTETDFIYVTTSSLTHEQLRAISEEVGPHRTLLICCKAFNANTEAFDNLTLKKIPQAVLTKCEWGKDDYSLNVAKLEPAERDDQAEPDLLNQTSEEV